MTKIALVTGGTRGIGASISSKLKASGYTVVANYASNDESAGSFSKENLTQSKRKEKNQKYTVLKNFTVTKF